MHQWAGRQCWEPWRGHTPRWHLPATGNRVTCGPLCSQGSPQKCSMGPGTTHCFTSLRGTPRKLCVGISPLRLVRTLRPAQCSPHSVVCNKRRNHDHTKSKRTLEIILGSTQVWRLNSLSESEMAPAPLLCWEVPSGFLRHFLEMQGFYLEMFYKGGTSGPRFHEEQQECSLAPRAFMTLLSPGENDVWPSTDKSHRQHITGC